MNGNVKGRLLARAVSCVIACLLALVWCATPALAETLPCQVNLSVDNRVEGDRPDTEENFTFELTGLDGAPMPADAEDGVAHARVAGTGTATFGTISYTVPEDYHYQIRQVAGSSQGYTYDDATYDVTVRITWEDGALVSTVWMGKTGSGAKTDGAEFVNEFKGAQGLPENIISSIGKLVSTGDMPPYSWVVALGGVCLVLAGLYARQRRAHRCSVHSEG